MIWDLARRGIWFNPEDLATIDRVFLPTFLDPPPGDELYVRKPVLDREGNSVSIVSGAVTIAETAGRDYRDQPAVYQQFVPLLNVTAEGRL